MTRREAWEQARKLLDEADRLDDEAVRVLDSGFGTAHFDPDHTLWLPCRHCGAHWAADPRYDDEQTAWCWDCDVSLLEEERETSESPRRREDVMRKWGRVPPRPRVVTLCGSTRFMEEFHRAGCEETLQGRIVLTVAVTKFGVDADGAHGGEALGEKVVRLLDELHLRKIDLSDEILVLNVGGYIGESTTSEIRYAMETGKHIRFLEPESGWAWVRKEEARVAE